MRVVDTVKDLQRTQEPLDPNCHRFVEGTDAERAEARRDWYRHNHIRKVVASDRTETERRDLDFFPGKADASCCQR